MPFHLSWAYGQHNIMFPGNSDNTDMRNRALGRYFGASIDDVVDSKNFF
jgi:hypothetical protein